MTASPVSVSKHPNSATDFILLPESAQTQGHTLNLMEKGSVIQKSKNGSQNKKGEKLHTNGKAHRAKSLKETTEVAQWLFQTLTLPPLYVVCPFMEIFQGTHFQEIWGWAWPFLLHSWRKPGAWLYPFIYKQGLSSLQRMRNNLQSTFKKYVLSYLITLMLIRTGNPQISIYSLICVYLSFCLCLKLSKLEPLSGVSSDSVDIEICGKMTPTWSTSLVCCTVKTLVEKRHFAANMLLQEIVKNNTLKQ